MGFEDIVFWHWWVIALAFLVIEMMITAYFFIWIAASAAMIGFVMLVVPDMAWQAQLSLWAVLSMITVSGYKLYRKKHPPEPSEGDDLALNQRGQQYVGRNFTIDQPIVNGVGKIEVDDTIWKVEAEEDLKEGTKVTVTGTDGTVLKVEAV